LIFSYIIESLVESRDSKKIISPKVKSSLIVLH
jgi:hypothetical protein